MGAERLRRVGSRRRANGGYIGIPALKRTFAHRPAPALKNEKADRPDLGVKNSELSVHKGSCGGGASLTGKRDGGRLWQSGFSFRRQSCPIEEPHRVRFRIPCSERISRSPPEDTDMRSQNSWSSPDEQIAAIAKELNRWLAQLDRLELWEPGAHLSRAIEALPGQRASLPPPLVGD